MKKTALIIFSFILLAAGLVALSACSIKSPSVKQAPKVVDVNEVAKENPATSTPVASTCENKNGVSRATTTNNCNTDAGEEWCESTQKCQVKWEVKCPGDKTINYDGQKFDAKTFKIICSSGTPFVEDKYGIHFPQDIDAEAGRTEWTVLNAKTFTNFNCTYFKDGNKILYNKLAGEVFYVENIAGADAATFETIKHDYIPALNNPYQTEKPLMVSIYDYAKDKNHVYGFGLIIPGVDQSSFKILDPGYSEDENNIYFSSGTNVAGSKIKDADAKTFKIISPLSEYWQGSGDSVSKDKNNVYCNGMILKGADAKTFKKLSDEERSKVNNSGDTEYGDKNNFYDSDCGIVK